MNNTHTTARTGHARVPPMTAEGADIAAHWTIDLDQAEIELLQLKYYSSLIVWRSMLREAKRTQTWVSTLTRQAIGAETRLSRSTITKALKRLVGVGYATIRDGGFGKGRRTITFRLTPIAGVTLVPPQFEDDEIPYPLREARPSGRLTPAFGPASPGSGLAIQKRST